MTLTKTAWSALADYSQQDPGRAFLHQPLDGNVLHWTRAETLDDARRFAGALLGLGLQPGDRVALLSKNCAEWVISDLAISLAGLVSVPVYPTAGRDTITYVIEHSGAKALIIGKLDNPGAPDGALSDDLVTIGMRYPSIACRYDWNALVAEADALPLPEPPRPNDVMTILYTSGSTGRPKGVVISYRAYQYACEASRDVLSASEDDRVLSYLPLAHITERTCVVGPSLYSGNQLFFTDRLETFVEDIKRARPTMFVSVPRLWVQFQAGVHAKIPPDRLKLLLKIPLVGRIVSRKVREQLGLDRCRLVGSGTAPISVATLRWYERIGIRISEGWGMSETSGLSCTNTPFRAERLGTIGVPLPGTEMKLSREGEVLIRCPGLFTEYYRQPELTAESFAPDGFFRTGDKGEWDPDLEAFRITGRVKDIFKSAKGKYVSPVPIESKLAGNPLIEQVCVMGSGLRAPVAVVVPSLSARASSRGVIGRSLGSTLDSVNATLESHERLSNIFVAVEPWSIDNGLLTPTLKIKRDQLEEKYSSLVKDAATERVVWLD